MIFRKYTVYIWESLASKASCRSWRKPTSKEHRSPIHRNLQERQQSLSLLPKESEVERSGGKATGKATATSYSPAYSPLCHFQMP